VSSAYRSGIHCWSQNILSGHASRDYSTNQSGLNFRVLMEPLLNVKDKNPFKFNNFWSVKLFRTLWNDKCAHYLLLESFPTISKAELGVQNVGTELWLDWYGGSHTTSSSVWCELSVWELKWPGAPSFLLGYMYVDAAPCFVSFQTKLWPWEAANQQHNFQKTVALVHNLLNFFI
jgi:hypothetical protein